MDRDTLLTRLQALGVDVEYLREALRLLIELLMELEISATIEAVPYERNTGRKGYRNGYRARRWRTDLGEISLRIPRLRKGSYHPSFMDSLSQAEPLLLALVQDAYLQGVSMRSVEEMLRRLGLPAVHQSQIADVCERLDDLVYRFRQRPLNSTYPYLWLDVLKLDARDSQPISVALAVGIHSANRSEILGFETIQDAHDADFWRSFLRGLTHRGLMDVKVIVSENHRIIRQAIREVFGDVYWQSLGSLENRVSGPSELVSAISTMLLDTRYRGLSHSPKSALMELFGADYLSAYTLISLNRALSQPADAVGMSLEEAAQWVGLASFTDEAAGQAQPALHQLYQPLAA